MNEIKALPEPELYTTLNYAGVVPFMTREIYLLGSSSHILSTLIKDRSANHPIFFGTDEYEEFSETFSENFRMSQQRIQPFLMNEDKTLFQIRSQKEKEVKDRRTKKRGEVLTPIGIVNQMIDVLEEEWKDLSLNDYLSQTVLELCCGEAPFLVQRYDSITGELFSVNKRRGILDRKLHRISKSTDNRKTWRDRAYQAVRSVYGYEYQGDSLFLGRENLLFDYLEHHFAKFHELPPINEINSVATIISWNMFQMDGIKNEVPYFDPQQQELFETTERFHIKPLVTLWESKGHEPKKKEKRRYGDEKMKFDVVIGNPAYQRERQGTSNRDEPIYHLFYEETKKVSNKVLLITPGRFLFNAGQTPKEWNQKMLNDPHFKVLEYNPEGSAYFDEVDIKGGIAIGYYDQNKNFGTINTFIPYPLLDSIGKKVKNAPGFQPITSIIYPRSSYKFTDILYKENPEVRSQLSKGNTKDISTNIFTRAPQLFFKDKPDDGEDYIQIFGRDNNVRVKKYIKRKYINKVDNLNYFKVFVPKTNGSGSFGEVFSNPVVEIPGVGATQTFMSIGKFNSYQEAENLNKYLSTKFLRALFGILKITQDNPPAVWSFIPLQNFSSSSNSDIDWTQSIQEIDKQLYAKYGFSDEEISFIETHVKEMI